MNKKTIRFILLVVAATACAAVGITHLFSERTAGSGYDQIREEASVGNTKESALPEETAEGRTASAEETEEEEIPIDFAALQETCPDAYAWIRIEDTQVDYPIVQDSEDDAFYLTHSADRSRDSAGAIFTESLNSRDFTDFNTVIYGHNMKNGSMFRTLHNFEDRDFFNSHKDLTIYLPDKVLHYLIFAAYTYDDRHILTSFDFSDPDIRRDYLYQILTMKSMTAFIRDGVTISDEDRIITLSTCIGNPDLRYLVQAVCLSETNEVAD